MTARESQYYVNYFKAWKIKLMNYFYERNVMPIAKPNKQCKNENHRPIHLLISKQK